MSERPRRFFLPLIGFMLLFAAFGPAIGGVLFVADRHRRWRRRTRRTRPALSAQSRRCSAHGLALVFAYVVGIGPAAAAGFVYGLWDAAAPGGSAARARRGAHRRRRSLISSFCGSPRSARRSRRRRDAT